MGPGLRRLCARGGAEPGKREGTGQEGHLPASGKPSRGSSAPRPMPYSRPTRMILTAWFCAGSSTSARATRLPPRPTPGPPSRPTRSTRTHSSCWLACCRKRATSTGPCRCWTPPSRPTRTRPTSSSCSRASTASRAKVDEGLAVLDELAQQHPTELAYQLQYAQALSQVGRKDEAEKALRRAVARQPGRHQDQAPAGRLSGQDPRRRCWRERASGSSLPPRRAITTSSSPLGSSIVQRERRMPAEATYRKIIEGADTSPPGLKARSALAAMLAAAGRLKEAQPLVDEVLKDNPSDGDALMVHAALALKEGDPTQAVADTRAVLKNAPESVPALRLLAQAHQQKKETSLARDALEKVVALEPKSPRAYLELAQLLANSGDRRGPCACSSSSPTRSRKTPPARRPRPRSSSASGTGAPCRRPPSASARRGPTTHGLLPGGAGVAAAGKAGGECATIRDGAAEVARGGRAPGRPGPQLRCPQAAGEGRGAAAGSCLAADPNNAVALNLLGDLYVRRTACRRRRSNTRRP